MATPMQAAQLFVTITASTGAAEGKITKFDGHLRKVEASANRTSNAVGGRLAKGLKVAGAAAAVGLGYGLYKAAKVGSEFESQMDSVGAVSEASGKQMKALEKQALKLGEATFFSANDVAKAQGELVKGGLKTSQILGGALPAALSLAEAGQLDLAVASETTVNAMKLFGLEGKDAGQIADMLATAANKTTADVTDFAMALKQGGSVAKLAGLDLNKTVTILEALAEAGIKNSDAGTSMKTSLVQLLKPSEKQAKLAKELGIQWTTQAGTIKTAAGLSKELQRATDGMTKAERAKTLATLAGTDGVRTLNALYDAGPAKLRSLERANQKQGTAQEIASRKMDNFKGDLEQLSGSIETFGIKTYKAFAPALRSIAQDGTEFVNELSDIFSDKNLSFGERLEKGFSLLSDKLTELLSVVVTHLIKAASLVGPRLVAALAKGIWNAWMDLNPLGKLFATATLIRAVGGKGAVLASGTALGRWIGLGVASGASTSMAASGATGGLVEILGGGAAAGGAGRWLGTEGSKAAFMRSQGVTLAATERQALAAQGGIFAGVAGQTAASKFGGGFTSALKSIKWGRIGGLGLGLALADNILGEVNRRINEHSSDLTTRLGADAKKQDAVSFARENIIGPFINPLFGDADVGAQKAAAKNLLAQVEQLEHRRVKISNVTQGQLMKEAEELDLTKKQREQLDGVFSLMRQGSGLHVGVQLGMDPQKLEQLATGFDTLRSGVLTSMNDIGQVVQRNAQIIGTQLPKGSKDARDKMAENFRSASSAIALAMQHGDISVKTGLAHMRSLLHNAQVVSGEDPLGLAKGFASSWRKAGAINAKQRQQMIADLGRMPNAARQKAFEAMMSYGHGLVQGGKIPKKDLRDFRSDALASLETLKTKGTQSSLDLAIGISRNFGSMGSAVATVLSVIKDNTNNSLGAFGASPLNFVVKKVGEFLGFGSQKKQQGGPIVPGGGSGDKFHTALPVGSFIMNREATKAFGLAKGGMMPVALEPGERRFLPHEVAAVGARNLEAMNKAVPRFQKGGTLGKPEIGGPAGPLKTIGQGAVDKVYAAAQHYVDKHRPKASAGLGFIGAPANMEQLGDNRYVDSHTLAVTALLDKMFGLTMSSGYRSPQHNAEIGGAPGSLHTHGSAANPGATDSVGSMGAMQSYIAFAVKHVAGLREAMVDNYAGLGSNAHLGFFAKGGLLQRLAEGGWVHGSAKLSADQLATLAHFVGMKSPGLMSQIAQAESGGDPTVTNSIGARGLWQIIPSTAKAFGLNYGSLTDPLANAKGAAKVLESQGLGAWDGYTNGSYANFPKGRVSGSLSGAGGKDEKVVAVYHGARTASLSFGSVPKSLKGIEKELRERRREAKQYRAAADRAGKEGKSKTQHAISVNVTALEGRIRELERERAKQRREAAKRKISKRFGKALGALTGFEPLIAAKERAFDGQQQFVTQLVELEPMAPEISEKATNAERDAAEGKHVADVIRYVWTQEQPAYQALLGAAGSWRNTVLAAQQKAAGPWRTAKTLGGLEGNWEDRIISVSGEIDRISNLPKEHTAKYWKAHPKAYQHMQEQLDKLPMLRFQDRELRKVLGEGREKFFPGKARVRDPIPPFPGSGSFEEALTNVQGIHWPDQHEQLTNLPAQRIAGKFGGAIWDVQTSIGELGLKIRDAASGVTGGEESDSGDSERESLLNELLLKANQRNLVFERQKPIIDAYEAKHPFVGAFAEGGRVAQKGFALVGERGPEIAQFPAGTQITPNDRIGAMVGAATPVELSLIVEDGAVDVGKIKVIANGEAVKVSRKQGPGARTIGARKAGRLV
jgi:TP901 family phage tail tape measure protein